MLGPQSQRAGFDFTFKFIQMNAKSSRLYPVALLLAQF
jgi:hypothetical protein